MGGGVPLRYSIGLWLGASGLAFFLCLHHLSATFVDGAFLPADNDSFYHARRILDALPAPFSLYQFDPRIHAPEGSWVTWPWAYDTLLAIAVRAALALGIAADPMPVLAFVAPAWVFVNAALFLGVAVRLQLSLASRALAMLFFAVSPLTQTLHRVGMVDHHYVEYTFVLAALYLGLGWLRDLGGRRHAAALGVVLGAAPAFHNGLFVLQVPVLAALACLWAMRRPLDRPGIVTFAAALAGASAVFLLPSEPFRQGMFSYYLHSWFHLYVAGCAALLCVLASRLEATPRNAAVLAAAALVLAVPVLMQAPLGGAFLFGRLEYHAGIQEMGSLPGAIARGQLWYLTRDYSPLLWLLPVGIGWLFWRVRRQPHGANVYFLVAALFGAFLMLLQFRLKYFGAFALILPLCLLADDLRRAPAASRLPRAWSLGLAAVILAAMLPGLPQLRQPTPLASDFQYHLTRAVYPALKTACAVRPGVVLADYVDGHYIRFHSECAVISDMFILTPQHVEKIRESERLLAGSLAELLERAPYVRYIYVRRADNVLDDTRGCGVACPENRGLRMELLSSDAPYPGRLRLLMDLRLQARAGSEPLARIFEVTPSGLQ